MMTAVINGCELRVKGEGAGGAPRDGQLYWNHVPSAASIPEFVPHFRGDVSEA